jgi:hypothetical protein
MSMEASVYYEKSAVSLRDVIKLLEIFAKNAAVPDAQAAC